MRASSLPHEILFMITNHYFGLSPWKRNKIIRAREFSQINFFSFAFCLLVSAECQVSENAAEKLCCCNLHSAVQFWDQTSRRTDIKIFSTKEQPNFEKRIRIWSSRKYETAPSWDCFLKEIKKKTRTFSKIPSFGKIREKFVSLRLTAYFNASSFSTCS